MPIYKDCTLGEMMVVGAAVFLTMSVVLSLITKVIFGIAWIGFGITLLSLVHITRFLLGRLQKIKYGKPYGYYKQLIIKKSFKSKLISALFDMDYIQRIGKWSVRRG